MRVGLSLSLCVTAILRGDVKIEDVLLIVCGFDIHPQDYIGGHGYNMCCKHYWSKYSKEEIDNVLNHFINGGMLINSYSFMDKRVPTIDVSEDGIWVDLPYHALP